MKILFVFSLDNCEWGPRPLASAMEMQFGISYISSLLKKNGHETRLSIVSKMFKTSVPRFIGLLHDFQPTVICFTAVFSEYEFIARMADIAARECPGVYRLIGGVHATLNPDDVIRDNFDALCVGEGELPTLELVKQLSLGVRPSGIPNLWIKQHGGVQKNPTNPFLADLDELPFPDREMWVEWVKVAPTERHSILLGRGCPFVCSYCCNHALRKISVGKYVRFRSPQNIRDEIAEIAARFPCTTEIYLEVETITANISWFKELCSLLEQYNRSRSKPLTFGVNIRVTPHIELGDVFWKCRDAGFRFVNIGLESGSERIRREVLKRNYSNDDVVRVVDSARRAGLKVSLFNLIGIPGETRKDIFDTIRVNRDCQPDYHALSIFFPYPGTELHRECRKRGLLDAEVNRQLERNQVTLKVPLADKMRIQWIYNLFDYYVFKGRKPVHQILAPTIYRWLRSNPSLWRTWRRMSSTGLLLSWRRMLTRAITK